LAFLLLPGGLFAGLTACNSQLAHPRSRYELHGEVVSLDKVHHEIEVKHGDIPGLMLAMTMAYQVRDEKALEKLSPGNQIRANVVVNGDTMTLENITAIKR
jgi:Cu/Ag efflux protein CusF